MSLTDPLTGLRNRRSFERRLEELTAECDRSGRAASLVLLDIDRFKAINDELGHPVGDHVLQVVGAALRGATRGGVTAARVGGEELALLLPATDEADALAVAERIREAVSQRVQRTGVLPAGRALTLSAGVATYRGGDSRELLAAADGALYLAKCGGRDRSEVAATAPQLPPPGPAELPEHGGGPHRRDEPVRRGTDRQAERVDRRGERIWSFPW